MKTMNPTPSPPPPRGDVTREALIRAATEIFARDGFHAASTRAIAQAASVNQALIGYHFSGKQGLYLAVFDAIAAQMQAKIGPQAQHIQSILNQEVSFADDAARHAHYLPLLFGLCEGMLQLMLGQETEHWSQLILREQQHPTDAFNRLYASFMGRTLGIATLIVQRLRNEETDDPAKEIVVGIIGQILVWRMARASVMRHLHWTAVGETEFLQARKALRRSLVAHVFQAKVTDEV